MILPKLKYRIYNITKSIATAFCCFVISFCKAQVSSEQVSVFMPEVALMDIEPNSSTISLSMSTPKEAGLMEIKTFADNVKWINYSSATESSKRRGIFVQLSGGSIPSGTELFISAGNSVSGAGVLGFGGSVSITNTPKLLINSIGGAFTGNGVNMGHPISYKLEIIDMGKLDVDESQTVTISFTIVDI